MLLFDLETDGLLDTVTTTHCAVTYDTSTDIFKRYTPTDIPEFLKDLGVANEICGHNVIGYDLPVLKKLYGFSPREGTVIRDTLVWARLCWSDIKQGDFTLVAKGTLPGKLIGSHSLAAYGYRLGELKGDYGKTQGAWEEYNDEMLDYCQQDVVVTKLLYEKLCDKAIPEGAVLLEHQVATIIQRQIEHGFLFDVKKAEALYCELLAKRTDLTEKLLEVFKPWYMKTKEFTPKGNNKKLGYISGCPLTMIVLTEFNPSSRHHIAYHLKKRYDWEPTEFTDKGDPKIDETVLSQMGVPEAKLLAELFMVEKRIGMLSEGKQSWLKLVKPTGRIHGGVITNGTPTGRATHSNPNVSQVCSTRVPYGKEMRGLWVVPKGYKLVDVDASGLELRCLAHYLARYDEGRYVKIVTEGKSSLGTDIHTMNQKAAGLETRDQAKTMIYCMIYGGGDEKLGSIVGKGMVAGRDLKKKFLKNTPGYAELLKAVESAVKTKGYVTCLDGRQVPTRSTHSALNYLLQSCGAILMKKAMVIAHELIAAKGLTDKCHQIAWIHDAIDMEAQEDVAEEVGQCIIQAIRDAGTYYNLRCPMDGDKHIGDNWSEVH